MCTAAFSFDGGCSCLLLLVQVILSSFVFDSVYPTFVSILKYFYLLYLYFHFHFYLYLYLYPYLLFYSSPSPICLHILYFRFFLTSLHFIPPTPFHLCSQFIHHSIISKLSLSCSYHFTALLCVVLYCTVMHCTLLHCTVLHYTVLYCTALYCTTLHCTVLHCTALHCTALHCTALHCTTLYCTVLYCTTLHCTALHHYQEATWTMISS